MSAECRRLAGRRRSQTAATVWSRLTLLMQHAGQRKTERSRNSLLPEQPICRFSLNGVRDGVIFRLLFRQISFAPKAFGVYRNSQFGLTEAVRLRQSAFITQC